MLFCCFGCSGCYGVGVIVYVLDLLGIYGICVVLFDGSMVKVDDCYLYDLIMLFDL